MPNVFSFRETINRNKPVLIPNGMIIFNCCLEKKALQYCPDCILEYILILRFQNNFRLGYTYLFLPQ